MYIVTVLLLLVSAELLSALNIYVYNSTDDSMLRIYEDPTASISGRAYSINKKIVGPVMYPNPRNACSTVEAPPTLVEDNLTWIAFLEDYYSCPFDNTENLKNAGYSLMITPLTGDGLYRTRSTLPQAMVTIGFAEYIEDNVIVLNYSSTDSFSEYLEVVNGPSVYELIIVMFGIVLISAILIAVLIFCGSMLFRWLATKWRSRSLTRWQVSRLPKRRYRSKKDKCHTCPICLEDFKEKEYMRVLPCSHVYHPKCVDEWLHKWNRTCPLCKSSVSRSARPTSMRRAERTPLLETDTEPSSAPSREDMYGAVGGRSSLSNPSSSPVVHPPEPDHALVIMHSNEEIDIEQNSSTASAAAI